MRRRLLSGLAPEAAAAGHTSLLETAVYPLDHSAQSAQHPGQPPNPALGGIAIRCCGQLSFHRPPSPSEHLSSTQDQIAGSHGHPARPKIPESAPSAAQGEAENSEVGHEKSADTPPRMEQAGHFSRGGPKGGEPEGEGLRERLALVWRVKLKECVDASPVVLLQRMRLEGETSMRCAWHYLVLVALFAHHLQTVIVLAMAA